MALSDSEIDAILATGDPEQIEKLLAEEGDASGFEEEETDEAEAAEEGAAESTPEPKAEAPESSPAEPPEEEKPVVLTKDGKHAIPYEELERARAEARVTKQEYQQAKSLIDELTAKQEEMTRRLEWTDKQLKKAGIDNTEPPENVQLTEKQLDELEENYGELGSVIRALHAQNKVLMNSVTKAPQGQHQSVPETTAPDSKQEIVRAVNIAIESNSDLRTWRGSDPARFQQAAQIDDLLKTDPKWGSKTLEERFTEVVRRTKAVFGDTESPAMTQQQKDNVKRKADAVLSNAKSPTTPDSLSDITPTNTDVEKPLVQRMAELTPDQIAAQMDRMTPAQIEALLESL